MRDINKVPYYKFAFKHVKHHGKVCKWVKVLMYLYDNGPQPRWKIIRDVWKNGCNPGDYHDLWRGFNSTLFSAMHWRNLIEYDPKTRLWHANQPEKWRKEKPDNV